MKLYTVRIESTHHIHNVHDQQTVTEKQFEALSPQQALFAAAATINAQGATLTSTTYEPSTRGKY
ncbi:MAG: hypothetical protein QNI96_05150 [Woeseiaceae bacterium]|nr:hypothetical protein [Woeseiaceae bacterium]